jgi:hypothetical protein
MHHFSGSPREEKRIAATPELLPVTRASPDTGRKDENFRHIQAQVFRHVNLKSRYPELYLK